MCRASLLILVLLAAGCGAEERGAVSRAPAGTAPAATVAAASRSAAEANPSGTTITVRASRFGPMLWGPRRQAIYVFQRDGRNRTRCYGECARAWPPVYTKARPVAGRGVRRALLGTLRRRDGRRQVTYDGRPLYYYAHEGPGQVLCHDVNLNGGFWWVVGADGKRRP